MELSIKFKATIGVVNLQLTHQQMKDIAMCTVEADRKFLCFDRNGFVNDGDGIVTMVSSNFPADIYVEVTDTIMDERVVLMSLEEEY